nr:hypothetical protein [Pandoravirus belohorizontensis]
MQIGDGMQRACVAPFFYVAGRFSASSCVPHAHTKARQGAIVGWAAVAFAVSRSLFAKSTPCPFAFFVCNRLNPFFFLFLLALASRRRYGVPFGGSPTFSLPRFVLGRPAW